MEITKLRNDILNDSDNIEDHVTEYLKEEDWYQENYHNSFMAGTLIGVVKMLSEDINEALTELQKIKCEDYLTQQTINRAIKLLKR